MGKYSGIDNEKHPHSCVITPVVVVVALVVVPTPIAISSAGLRVVRFFCEAKELAVLDIKVFSR